VNDILPKNKVKNTYETTQEECSGVWSKRISVQRQIPLKMFILCNHFTTNWSLLLFHCLC